MCRGLVTVKNEKYHAGAGDNRGLREGGWGRYWEIEGGVIFYVVEVHIR